MRRNKGALTVEACLSFTVFLMVFLTIMYIVRIVFAYGIVQHSLNQVAKEMSSYTYFYAASGLKSVDDTIQNSTAAGEEAFNTGIGNIVNVYTELGNLGDAVGNVSGSLASGSIDEISGSISNLESSVSDFSAAVGEAKNTVKSVIDDPVGAIKVVGSVLLSGANETAKTLIFSELSRALMAKYIDSGGYEEANTRLKQLKIIDGLDGLNFSASKFWSDGSDIELVVCYTIKPIFPIKIVDKLHFMNKVKIRGWNGESIF